MIAMTQKSDFPLRGDYLFSNFITPQMQVETLGAYLFSTLGLTKAAILYPDEKYGRKYMNLFWDVADRYGAEITGAEAYDGHKTDFTLPIQKLTGQFYPVPDCLIPENTEQADITGDQAQDMVERETQPGPRAKKQPPKVKIDFQALFIPDSASALNMILPQLAYNDIRGVYLVGTNLWHNKSLLKNSGGYHNRAVITDGFFAEGTNPATIRFAAKFRNLFHRNPGFIEAIAHDSASILFITAMDEGIDSCTALKNTLQQGNRIFEGATGNTIFDHQGRAEKSLFLMTVKKGRFTEITR
jgi:ABC-type branched-subunit amino acid transport system substrate-binding protein